MQVTLYCFHNAEKSTHTFSDLGTRKLHPKSQPYPVVRRASYLTTRSTTELRFFRGDSSVWVLLSKKQKRISDSTFGNPFVILIELILFGC